MRYVADLHLHSKYSRAVSQDMVLPIMARFAKKKGLDILATGDWTHPLWFREIKNQLIKKSEGLFQLKSQFSSSKSQINSNNQNSNSQNEVNFILSTEISSIYSQGGRTRRIHNLVFSPSFQTAEKISAELLKRGCNLSSDGRPIIGLSSKQLIEVVLSIDKNAMLIPCHIWTPWFSLYGSNSGFDSIEECFGEYSKYIYAIETGLSSDPEMNWRIKELETRSIISSSDSHSPMKMGREATVFKLKTQNSPLRHPTSSRLRGTGGFAGQANLKITYMDIVSAIKQDPDSNLRIAGTIEFYPEEGKYHYTGHRNCNVVQSPTETKEKGVICPVCKKPLTVGVMQRVQDLARKFKIQNSRLDSAKRAKFKIDEYGVKWFYDPTNNHPPFVKLVPLIEIIAESLDSTVSSKKVLDLFNKLCESFNSEINILLKTKKEEIEKVAGEKVAEGIVKVRMGDIVVEPGFDGNYGKVKIWKTKDEKVFKKEEKKTLESQLGLDI